MDRNSKIKFTVIIYKIKRESFWGNRSVLGTIAKNSHDNVEDWIGYKKYIPIKEYEQIPFIVDDEEYDLLKDSKGTLSFLEDIKASFTNCEDSIIRYSYKSSDELNIEEQSLFTTEKSRNEFVNETFGVDYEKIPRNHFMIKPNLIGTMPSRKVKKYK